MRAFLALFICLAVGCVNNGKDPDPSDPSNPSDPSDPSDPTDPTAPVESCIGGNNCVCPGAAACGHTCSDGAIECHVQGGDGQVDVRCDNNAECHVECSSAASCAVDCGGSAECHVTCPSTGCTVTNCVISNGCEVSCDGNSTATLDGSTATCQ